MEIKWIENKNVLPTIEPLIVAIRYDESVAVAGLLDEGVEHAVLLRKVIGSDMELNRYFRIVVDQDGADWTFVCPVNYKNISNKEKRIMEFYKDGIAVIKKFLNQIGYPENIEIPKRYRRNMDLFSS